MSAAIESLMHRFNAAFKEHDGAAIAAMVAPDCVLENSSPAPDGARYVGHSEVTRFWAALANARENSWQTEEVFAAGDRAVIRWRLRWGLAENQQVRGINVMRVRDGLIVEGLGYIKG